MSACSGRRSGHTPTTTPTPATHTITQWLPDGGCADGYVNQDNYTNQWAVFGAVCTTDGTATIVLADDGGDVYPAIVGANAIRAVRLSFIC